MRELNSECRYRGSGKKPGLQSADMWSKLPACEREDSTWQVELQAPNKKGPPPNRGASLSLYSYLVSRISYLEIYGETKLITPVVPSARV